MNPRIKAHIISAVQTFIAAFGVAIYPMLSTFNGFDGLTKTVILAILFAGTRAGVKAVYEALILPWINKKIGIDNQPK